MPVQDKAANDLSKVADTSIDFTAITAHFLMPR